MSLATAPANFVCLYDVEVELLEARLQRQLRGRVSQLTLKLCAAGLILRGQADSYYLKQLVQHAVMQATRLPLFANEIEVMSPSRRGAALAGDDPQTAA